MGKTTDNYEEQVRKEFESTQEPTETPKQETVKNLGRVELDKTIDDPELERIKGSMDYVNIPLDTLPSGGRFYPEGTRIREFMYSIDKLIHRFVSNCFEGFE